MEFKSNTAVSEGHKPAEFIFTAELSADLRPHIIKHTHTHTSAGTQLHAHTGLKLKTHTLHLQTHEHTVHIH